MLFAFRGSVAVGHGEGAATVWLRGCNASSPADSRDQTELIFAAASAASLPSTLVDAQVSELPPLPSQDPRLRRYEISAGPWSAQLQARALHYHRDVAAAFYQAVPPPRVPLMRRLIIGMLLAVLRVPGAAALLRRLRGGR